MAGTRRRKSTPIFQGPEGPVTLSSPTPKTPRWTAVWKEGGKQRSASCGPVGTTREDAVAVARSKVLGAWHPTVEAPPTLAEVHATWMKRKRTTWSGRTYDNYTYVAKEVLASLGNREVTKVSPEMLARVDLSHLSAGQLRKVRTVVRGIFAEARDSTQRDPEIFAKAIVVSGTKADTKTQVERTEVPSSEWVGAAILCAYSTLQTSPLLLPPVASKTRALVGTTPPTTGTVDALGFLDGLPEETSGHRKGAPKQYTQKALDGMRARERAEIASLWRRAGLATALGACGMRIGEILALRPRHLLTTDEVAQLAAMANQRKAGAPDWQRDGHITMAKHPEEGQTVYRGRVSIEEQASQSSKGKIWVTTPKMDRPRVLWLPAFLPSWESKKLSTSARTYARKHLPRLGERASLWDATEEEMLSMWLAGYTPMKLLLRWRLMELWELANGDVETFRNRLIFPTRTKARVGRDGLPGVVFPNGWANRVRLVPNDGTYQASTNFAGRWTNPLYDHVSAMLGQAPQRERGDGKRSGYTSHSLRHWAVSHWLMAGVPVTTITQMAGWQDARILFERYGHWVPGDVANTGFEMP